MLVPNTARAEALFASRVPTDQHLTLAELDTAVAAAIRSCCGTAGCVGHLAFQAGDDPAGAVYRMRWALATVARLYPPPACPQHLPRMRLHTTVDATPHTNLVGV